MVLRRANCKRFTHIRPTDGSGSRPVSWSGERLSMAVHGQTRMLNAPAVSKSLVLFLLLLEFSLKQNNSTVNCQKLRSFPESSRLETDCISSKLTRMSSVQALSGYGRRICAWRLTAGQNTAQVRLAIRFAFHSAVQITVRSSPTHGLERSLARFLRLHRATLCRFSCLIH